jgi:hypothetical protein
MDMATYTVHYDFSKGSSSGTSSKTVTAETEATAIRIVEGKVRSERPGYEVFIKKVDHK